MKLHEVHASLVHAPLALLPTAVAIDMLAAGNGDRALDRVGARLWAIGTGSALLAGVAGLAASQEVRADDDKVSDTMLIHGLGNTAITLAAVGMSFYRASRRASWTSALIGLAACGAAVYTAYLGGEMVYAHGVGVDALPSWMNQGVKDSPDVLSKRTPRKFVKDVAGGFGWAMKSLFDMVRGEKKLQPEALRAAV